MPPIVVIVEAMSSKIIFDDAKESRVKKIPKIQESSFKNQDSRIKFQESRIKNQEQSRSRFKNQEKTQSR